MAGFNLSRYLSGFTQIFNFKDPQARGRSYILMDALMGTIINVFITGIFYTGFLSMYDISITEVGILTFIPWIANCFSLFSAPILERLRRRKPVLIAAWVYYFVMSILAMNVMPLIVTDPGQRVTWFCIILFLGNSVYSLFSNGWTAWYSLLYPTDNEKRTRYFTYSQTITSILSSTVLLLSSLLTDAVEGSAYQDQLILGLRYFAFGLVIVNAVFVLGRQHEPEYPKSTRVALKDVFTLSFKYKKFFYCMLFMFAWNFIANISNGIWSYHLLDHLNLPYTLINSVSIIYTCILVVTGPMWRKVLRRHGWIKTFGIALALHLPSEIAFFFAGTPELIGYLYMPLAIWQQFVGVGLNLSWANILYMNLPKEKSTAHIAFYTIGANLCAFLGLLSGTALSGITGDTSFQFMGLTMYSVLYTILLRSVLMVVVVYFCLRKWRIFTSDEDAREIDEMAEMSRKNALRRRSF